MLLCAERSFAIWHAHGVSEREVPHRQPLCNGASEPLIPDQLVRVTLRAMHHHLSRSCMCLNRQLFSLMVTKGFRTTLWSCHGRSIDIQCLGQCRPMTILGSLLRRESERHGLILRASIRVEDIMFSRQTKGNHCTNKCARSIASSVNVPPKFTKANYYEVVRPCYPMSGTPDIHKQRDLVAVAGSGWDKPWCRCSTEPPPNPGSKY